MVRFLLAPWFHLYARIVYGVKIEKYNGDKNQPCLILFNHQTSFDQFFVSIAFPKHVYYVSSEDLFSKKWISRVISYLVAPIPFRKSTSDVAAIKNCFRIMREGGTIAMAPEGNRTYSGTTEHMKPSVSSLAKALKMPIAFFRIEGGYGVQPRWSNCIRRGKMRAYFSSVIPYEEYKDKSDEELFEIIKRELYVDEREDTSNFKSRKSAEFLDRVIYYCPYCGLSEFYSKGRVITCKRCARQVEYTQNKRLAGVGFDFPYTYVKDWYDAQNSFVRQLDLSPYAEKSIFDDFAGFYDNIYCNKKILIDRRAKISIFADRFEIVTKRNSFVFNFNQVSSATVLGKNKLNIYTGNKIYQIKGDKHFNALKYLNIYWHAVNTKSEKDELQFLGL